MLSILLCGNICFAADFPQTLNYQGTLQTKTGQPVNEPQDITFSLYTTPLGAETPFWTETLPKVPVSNGQFSVTLGTVTTLDPAKFGGDTYIGIKVGANSEMTPRQKMTSVPYAFNGIPKGGIIMWSGTTVPVGWALCDGSKGTPNLRDRFIIGSGSSYSIGSIGGETAHTLTIAEMPSHTHKLRIRSSLLPASNITDVDPVRLSISGDWFGVVRSTENTGEDQPHNNLPPYYALAFIMKL